MPTFEEIDGVDEDGALAKALHLCEKVEWDPNDLSFFFNRMEIKMTVAKVKKNYTKFQVLSTILPRRDA